VWGFCTLWSVAMPEIDGAKLPERPRLATGVRLHFDRTRDAWVVLGPERVLETEGPASEILRRCDGKHTIAQIVDELAAFYNADRVQIAADVTEMLAELMAKRMLSA
jgi:pyrroloquinoline quinone biosynthesis protein D